MQILDLFEAVVVFHYNEFSKFIQIGPSHTVTHTADHKKLL